MRALVVLAWLVAFAHVPTLLATIGILILLLREADD